MSSAPLARQL
jgi:hypothetical protein